MTTRLINGASMLSKVAAGVLTALIIGVLVFGVQVYAFMNTGARFTPDNYHDGEQEQDRYIELRYVQKDVYEIQQEHILEELEDIKLMLKELKK